MMLPCIFVTLVAGVTLLPASHGNGLEGTEPSFVMKCKGSNLTLNEPDTGITVLRVYVFRGNESLASSTVAATGHFQDRLIVASDGRVTLNNLTADDLGLYRVEVKLSKDIRIQRSTRLVISEPPQTDNGTLAVDTVSSSGSNSVRLTCGNFTSLGFPPVSAVWEDPLGHVLPSDGFKDQAFYLDLPLDTAEPGDYCCRLDCPAPTYCCLEERSPLRQCAQVHVQTRKAGATVKITDYVSLASFSQLQQQVLDVAGAVRLLQESERQDCSQSGVAAMAQLIQRQARCDQLDAYVSRVEALEARLTAGLDDVRNASADARRQQEEKIEQSLENFRLQVSEQIMSNIQDAYDRLETFTNSSWESVWSRLEEISTEVYEHQSHVDQQFTDHDLETRRKLDGMQAAINDELWTMRGNLSLRLSDFETAVIANLTQTSQALAALELSVAYQTSAMEGNISSLWDALTSDAISVGQSTVDVRTELADLRTITETLRAGFCSLKSGYRYGGRCLKFYSDSVAFQSAKARCLADGAHLLYLKSRDVDKQLLRSNLIAAGLNVPTSASPVRIWMGATDITTEGTIVWDDGTPLPRTFPLWGSAEPNDAGGNEDCVELIMDTASLWLNDNICTVQHPHFCEYL